MKRQIGSERTPKLRRNDAEPVKMFIVWCVALDRRHERTGVTTNKDLAQAKVWWLDRLHYHGSHQVKTIWGIQTELDPLEGE